MTNCVRKISRHSYPSKPPLFCVPGVFGSPYYFTQLSRQLGLEQPFYSWQQADLWKNSSSFFSIETIASQYVLSLKKIQARGPYYLVGHSFGGLVAFEMARQLRTNQEEIALVIIIDAVAPIASQQVKLANFVEFAEDLDYLELIREMFENVFGDIVQLIDQPSSDKSVTSFETRLEQLQDLFLLLNPEENISAKQVFSLFKNNWKAMVDYTPPKIPQIPLLLCRAREKFPGKMSHIFFYQQVLENPSYGWSELTDNIKVYQIPGNHSTMFALPHVQVLASLLQAKLNSLSSSSYALV